MCYRHLNTRSQYCIYLFRNAVMLFDGSFKIVIFLFLNLFSLLNFLKQITLHFLEPEKFLVHLLNFIIEFHLLINNISGIKIFAIFILPIRFLFNVLFFRFWMDNIVRFTANSSSSYFALSIWLTLHLSFSCSLSILSCSNLFRRLST
jgi:hypothetical protein